MSKREQYIETPSPIAGILVRLFRRKHPAVIMDIGSCEGEDSVKYSKLFPAARILAFEPLPDNQKLIRDNIEKYGVKNIEIVPVALSDTKTIADFHVSSGNPEGRPNSEEWDFGNKSSSLLEPDKHKEITPWVKFDKVISVQTDTLKAVCEEKAISFVDFAHIDVQGAELRVLKGAGRLLSDIKAIWMEVSIVSLYKEQPLKNEVEEFMKKNGFCLYLNAVNGTTGDQMYLNRKYFWFYCFLSDIKKFIKN